MALTPELSTSAKPAATKWNADPYPSTYKPYPAAPTAIRGATILDGEGGKIERGFLVHGEPEGMNAIAPALQEQVLNPVIMPELLASYEV